MEIVKVLENEIASLISGNSDTERANAVAKLASQIVYKERLKVETTINNEKIRYWNRDTKGVKK